MHSSVPATFNMGLLFENIKVNKVEAAKVISFLKNKNIRDHRVGASECDNKGQSFCDISFDLAHYLFDSINFDQLLESDETGLVTQSKIDIYNNVVKHLKFDMLDEGRYALIKNTSEYLPKLRTYTKDLIKRAVELHKATDELNTVEEGVQSFWQIVDHYIFTNKIKCELDRLKTVIANSDSVLVWMNYEEYDV